MPGQVQERLQTPPHSIVRYLFGSWAEQALKTAVELDIFTALSAQPETADSVAGRLNANPRGIAVLLEALNAMELLEKKGAAYQLTEASRLYLLPQSELFMGPYLRVNEELKQLWAGLADSIRQGRPQECVNLQEKAEVFFPHLAAAIFPMNFATAQALAEKLQVESLPAGARILDLAAGAAVWSIPIAQRNGGLRVDALDFPATLATTKHFVEKYHLADRYEYLPGSWQQVALPENAYDIILLGHILHSEGRAESDRMLAGLQKSLKPSGRLVIAEFLTAPDRTGPLPALLFGLNMYLATEHGCVFSETELASMLEKHGYIQPERIPLPFLEQDSPIMIARKPG